MNKKLEPEEIENVLQELEGQILIVEGKKDEEALTKLLSGYPWPQPRASIVRINSRPVAEVAQDAAFLAEKHKNRQVIVLTDFDRTGSRLASRLRLLLQSRKIHANFRIRRDVMNLGIKCIEELASFKAAALEEHGGPAARAGRKPFVSRKSKFRECDDYGEIGANVDEIRGKGLHKGKRDNREA
jgi:5S rRNA maturation endonuclease (ribonuclease M5)